MSTSFLPCSTDVPLDKSSHGGLTPLQTGNNTPAFLRSMQDRPEDQNRIHHPLKHKTKPQLLLQLCKEAPMSPNSPGESFLQGLKPITAQHDKPPGRMKKHRATTSPEHSSYTSVKSCSSGLLFHLHDKWQALASPFRQACSARTTHQEPLYPGTLRSPQNTSYSLASSTRQKPCRKHHGTFTEDIPLTPNTSTPRNALGSLLHPCLLSLPHTVPGSSKKGMRAGSGALPLS